VNCRPLRAASRDRQVDGDEAGDCEQMKAAGGGLVDVVLDLMPPSVDGAGGENGGDDGAGVRADCVDGGVGMAGGADLALPYPWIMRNGITIRGQWMYPRTANRNMVNLIRSGLIDLDNWEVARFSLDRANEAVAHAARNGDPFRMTVIEP
jgi:alcohol dehydrogenase